MTQIKIFDSSMFINNVQQMEKEVNEFCSKVNVINIQYRTEIKQDAKYTSGMIHCVCITYNE